MFKRSTSTEKNYYLTIYNNNCNHRFEYNWAVTNQLFADVCARVGVFSLHTALTEVTVVMRVLSSPSVFLPWNLSQHRFQRVAVQNLGYSRRHHLTCTQKGRVSQRHVVADLLSVQTGWEPSCPLLGEPAGAKQLAVCDGCSEWITCQKPSPRSAKTHSWPPEQLCYNVL